MKRFVKRHTYTALVFAVLTSSACAAEIPGTMRVDFFHSGNHSAELLSLDQLVIEPLPWTGNMAQPIDRTLRGKYLFEIVSNGVTAWSRSFSSIYGEWETTSEAREINRSFHESVRFPSQDEVFEIVLKKRDANNQFEEIWRIELDPDDVLVHRESARYADKVIAIHKGGDPANTVDLLLMGDGYTAEEHDAFIDKAKMLADVLFATSPFKERKDDFNIWALAPAAPQSGVSRPSTGTYRDSPIGATYDAFRSERYILTFDNKSMRRIASSAPYDFIEILTNTDVYGGGGIYGLFSTAAANSEWAPYLFVHEFGHHFAGLADEYYTSSVAYEAPAEISEPYEPNVTALLDPKKLKWKHLVQSETPLPTPWPKAEFEKHSIAVQQRRAEMRAANVSEAEMNSLFRYTRDYADALFEKSGQEGVVGAFEGGNYQAEGYYRSEQNCLMFTRSESFCAVCAAAIEKVIDEYTVSD
ncbi:MAG: IgA Peptidase M64 [Gammaproteobacteria bacterium]|nr:IgA Peptidase M64 [Gammaproteobacteria bacterium]MBT8110389.1 IgA Peptidase M64 [Gammaproteobacteria bacterium]NNC57622.1 peptidase M64 [Woeseiaceae bacterium]NNL45090.1 peptidase M64 [Woeseiaceae bacterium]